MQLGQFLINANGEKRKILFASGDLIIPSLIGDFDVASGNFTKKELLELGWSPLEEPWRPMLAEIYWYVNEDGNFGKTNWGIDGMEEHDFRYSIGNVHQNLSEAKLYKQKLIERMGRKE